MTTATRPTTCGAIARLDATLGQVGCKRLPRHTGEHRAFLTVRAMHKAERIATTATKTSKTSPKGKRTRSARAMTMTQRRAIVRTLRVAAGAPERGRVTTSLRRKMMAELNTLVTSGNVTAFDALGVAALI